MGEIPAPHELWRLIAVSLLSAREVLAVRLPRFKDQPMRASTANRVIIDTLLWCVRKPSIRM
jgi:hypothetical protein